MMVWYSTFTTCLCFAVSLRVCSALPYTTTRASLGHLSTRDDNSSAPLVGDYSFLSFNPKTEADLWNAIMNIKPETFAVFFSPDYPILQGVLDSGSFSNLAKLINDVFANNIAHTQQNSSDEINNDTADELGAPRDPSVITQHGYQGKFFDYKLEGVRIPWFEAQELSFALFAQISGEWAAAGCPIDAPYPRPNFSSARSGSTWRSIWTLRSGASRFSYEDIIGAVQIFGTWSIDWREPNTVPGTAIQLMKQNRASRAYEELATGDLVISAPSSSTDTDVPTSR